jgi:MFS family permease
MSLHESGQSPQAGPPSTVQRKLGFALLVIATAQLMLVLDDTIVNVALPTIHRSLHIPTSHLNWVASFYALTFGGLLLAGGRAGDSYGRLRMFRVGIVIFALASMAGGFAPNGTALLMARLVQGCGARWPDRQVRPVPRAPFLDGAHYGHRRRGDRPEVVGPSATASV